MPTPKAGWVRSFSNAFTLIEFLIIIAVIGLVSAAALTSFIDTQSTNLLAAVQRVQTDIRYTQQLAMSLQLRTRLTFDDATDSYTVEYESSPGTWVFATDPLTRQNFQVNLNTGVYQDVTITQVVLGSGNLLIFDDRGSPFTNGDVPLVEPAFIALNTKQIQVTAKTGRVVIA